MNVEIIILRGFIFIVEFVLCLFIFTMITACFIERWRSVSIIVVFALAIGVATIATLITDHSLEQEQAQWNNGVCISCERGHYQLSEVSTLNSRHSHTTTYYWVCDECGYIYETTIDHIDNYNANLNR